MNTLSTPVDRLRAHRDRHGVTILAALEHEHRQRELRGSVWRVPGSLPVVIAALVILLGGTLIAAELPRAGLF